MACLAELVTARHERDEVVDGDRHRGLEAVDVVAGAVAHEQHGDAGLVEDLGGVHVVGREHRPLLAPFLHLQQVGDAHPTLGRGLRSGAVGSGALGGRAMLAHARIVAPGRSLPFLDPRLGPLVQERLSCPECLRKIFRIARRAKSARFACFLMSRAPTDRARGTHHGGPVTPRIIVAMTGAAAVACTLAISAPAPRNPRTTRQQHRSGSPRRTTAPARRRPSRQPSARRRSRCSRTARPSSRRRPAVARPSPSPAQGRRRRVPRRQDGQDLHRPLRSSARTSSGRLGTDPGPLHNQIPEPDRDQEQLDRTGSTTSTRRTTRRCSTARASRSRTTTPSCPPASTRRSTPSPTGSRCPETPPATATTRSRTTAAPGRSSRDSVDAWYANELASGKTATEIDAYLSQFDVWDRYDFNEDGNFNEADGYLDHFQAVHAGGGEEGGARR